MAQYRKEFNDAEVARFENLKTFYANLGDSAVTPIPEKPGFGRVLINASLFLTAADIGWQIGDGIKKAGDEAVRTKWLEELDAGILDGSIVTSYGGITAWYDNSKAMTNDLAPFFFVGSKYSWGWSNMDWTAPAWIYLESITHTASAVNMIAQMRYSQNGYPNESKSYVVDFSPSDLTTDYKVTEMIPDVSWIPELAPMPWVTNNPDVGSLPEMIPVDIPLTADYPETVSEPWNDPDADLTTDIVAEPLPDSPPPDGGSGDTGDTGDTGGSNPFKDLVPIAFLMALLDLLRAILEYLARMMAFVVKIPMIGPKPVDNVAFEWFRNAKILGVYIYNVVSSLASLGLAFAVYKSIRKLLP